MIKLSCKSCGKVHYLNSINDFSSCNCGASLEKSSISLIEDIENQIIEAKADIYRAANDGRASDFFIDFI